MIAINHAYLQDQPSIAHDLFKAVSNHFSDYLRKRSFEVEFKKFESKAFEVIGKAHEYNAKMEQVRDFVDLYYVNDIQEDEKLLNQFFDLIENTLPDIEFVLDSEDIATLPTPVRDTIIGAYDELYSTMVNINFAISQKIAQSYANSKSNLKLLQDA